MTHHLLVTFHPQQGCLGETATSVTSTLEMFRTWGGNEVQIAFIIVCGLWHEMSQSSALRLLQWKKKGREERGKKREKIDQTHPVSEHRAQPERFKGVPADTGINYPLLPHRRLLFLLPAKLRLKWGRVVAGERDDLRFFLSTNRRSSCLKP